HAAAMGCYERAGPMLDGDPTEQALCIMGIGMILRHAERYADAVAAGGGAGRVLGPPRRAVPLATALMNLALAELELGRSAVALAHCTRAVELLDGCGGAVQAEYARINVAHALLQSGEPGRAAEQYHRINPARFGGEPLFRFHFGFGL